MKCLVGDGMDFLSTSQAFLLPRYR